MLSSCFFLIGIGFICKKNFRKTFQRLLGKVPRRFCDQLTFSIIQVLTHFLEFLKICPKMFPFFSLKWKNQTIGGNWTKYCTVAKSVGWAWPIWPSVVICAYYFRSAAGSINSGRHILESRCAERCANKAFLTSFRATLRPTGGDPGLDHLQKIFFWQFVFPWVDLALLKPMKNFLWDKCVIQATKTTRKVVSYLTPFGAACASAQLTG